MTSDKIARGRYVSGGRVEKVSNRLGWWERKIFPSSVDDVNYVLVSRYNQRPDLLAYDAYGYSHLAWFILQYNNIINIHEEFVTGSTIILPTRTRAIQLVS